MGCLPLLREYATAIHPLATVSCTLTHMARSFPPSWRTKAAYVAFASFNIPMIGSLLQSFTTASTPSVHTALYSYSHTKLAGWYVRKNHGCHRTFVPIR
eukprot:12900618-Prorocentrum_lima.AAC.1